VAKEDPWGLKYEGGEGRQRVDPVASSDAEPMGQATHEGDQPDKGE